MTRKNSVINYVDDLAREPKVYALPTKRGWLKRKTRNVFKPWVTRYFVLSNKLLSFYRKETDIYPCGTLNFDAISVKVFIYGDNEIQIHPKGT